MPSSNSSSQDSSPIDLPDKEYLYGEFFKPLRWKHRLEEKLAHKSLDIPMDDGMDNVGNKHGLGWKELAVIGGVGLVGYSLATRQPDPPTVPVQPPAVTAPHEDRDTTRGIGIRKYVPPSKGKVSQ